MMRGNAKSGGGTKTDFLCIMIANLRRDLHTGVAGRARGVNDCGNLDFKVFARYCY